MDLGEECRKVNRPSHHIHIRTAGPTLITWLWRFPQGFSSVKLLFPPFCAPSLTHLLSHCFQISTMTALIHNPITGKVLRERCFPFIPLLVHETVLPSLFYKEIEAHWNETVVNY